MPLLEHNWVTAMNLLLLGIHMRNQYLNYFPPGSSIDLTGFPAACSSIKLVLLESRRRRQRIFSSLQEARRVRELGEQEEKFQAERQEWHQKIDQMHQELEETLAKASTTDTRLSDTQANLLEMENSLMESNFEEQMRKAKEEARELQATRVKLEEERQPEENDPSCS